MLPRASRLRNPREFRAVVKDGVRAGGTGVVVHLRGGTAETSRAGFIVSKAVGNAVTRNRVKRQLRHLMRPELSESEPAVDVVVRALPSAAEGVAKTDVAAAMAKARACLAGTGRR